MWFPPTPEKQVVQNAHSENHESHQARGEDWGNLLGVYSEMLQNDMPNTVLGNDYDVTPGKQFNMLQLNPEPGGVMLSSNDGLWIKDAAHSSVQQQHRLPWEDNPINSTGLCNPQQESNQELGMLQQCVRRNQGVVASGSSLGQIPQQKVRSLAELMASSGARPGQFLNGDPVVRSQAHIQIDQVARAIARTEVHPGPNLNAQHASYHRQGMTSSSHSSSYPGDHNLNLRTSLGGETSTIPVSQPLGPVTPDVQRQARNITPQIIPWGCVRETSEQNNVLLMKQVPVSQALRPATTEVQGQPQNATQVPQLITLGCTQESHEQAKQTEVLKQQDGMLANVGSTNTAFSNSDEKNNLHNGSEGIDLNRTPQQKPPKRKKYLPKVVVEGKLKRTPKSAAVKTTTPGGNSPAKRSYVRKNGIKTSLSGTEDVEPADMGLVKKSCRRALNFDLDETTKKQQKDEKSNTQAENTDGGLQQPFNLNEVQNTAGSEIQQRTTAIANSASKISVQDLGNTAEKPRARDISLNEIARNFSTQSNLINQCSSNSTSNQVHQAMGAGLAQQLYLLANANKAKMNDEGRPWLQGMAQNQNDVLIGVENHCLKKPYASSGLRKPQTTSFMGPELGLPGYPEVRPCNTYIPWHDDSDVGKKRHLDGNFHEPSSSHHYEHLLQVERQVRNNLRAHSSFVGNNDGLNPTYQSRKAFPDVPQHSYNRSYMSSGELYLQQRKQQMLQQISMSKNTNPGELTKWNPGAAVGSPDRVAVRKRTAGEISSKKLSPNVIHEKRSTNSRSYGSSLKGKGSKKQREPLTADDLVDCLKRLDLNSNNSKNDEYALVPYGANGAIVPHEGIDPAKRRFPRPKVDLDLETNRLWNLLMGKEGSGSAEMDKDKQKWWEEERRVFRGRIDSFIARMHLVQGDRRFSKWKGSVVDSVVGVFLTQNVSDHLSSSAFMCLAAKFPRKMKNSSQSRQAAEDSSSANHNDIHITFPDQTTTDHKTDGELTYNQSSVTTVESMGSYVVRTEDDVISSQSSSGSLIFTASKDVRSSSGSNSEAEEGCIISGNLLHENAERAALVQQDTFQSKESLLPNKTPLIVENHQLEDTVYGQSAKHANIRNEILNPFVSKGPHDQATFLQSTNTWQCMQMDLEKWDADFLTVPEKQSSSSLASATFEARDEVITEGSNTNRMLHTEGTSVAIVSGTQELNPLQEDSDIQRSINQRSEDEDFQLRKTRKQQAVPLEERLQMNPISQDVAENLKSKGNMISEQAKKKPPTDGSQPYLLTKQPNKSNSVPSKPASQKTEKMKEAFNWDTLRKQAELKYGTKERSWEAMDSLDYEALRNASVHVISDTIKERGMNNMLAERIKDFLDRLVQDHGRVDLEWLRDVPPDKVKDYLLSIRGLGLKSVECVRLLTLHNLAFPVDTNVGRIAVRLGWVPLQPLPESLQLHLLELYPVLETIQKYLWPRLCNLDQETLYELHYQMITFGKVFCTKRDPNCNACPMRGECRHFASAFASARLALPGPQERQLVNSSHSHPTVSNNVPEKTTNPLLLPSSVENIEQKSETPKICEPVIEEPTTPELPHADLERDIEDAFYNDPDEIPVIELNVKEFASNLQSFMQENMEIAEADMSKALVALSPELASIPAPKLKHVSRLRTEHQVYELPDSHPLLERMDVREADDPSPYLLAIWSPGETADSFQPPESKCRSQELGELCFDSTCFACNSKKEAQALTVRGTILIPCRTAMRGSFPLNGTYFQVNEVFADHASSLKPIDVPRSLIWKLPRRTVFFGTSVSTIFKGLSTEAIQHCFWRGFVCVRGFDQQSRAPRPLMARLHFPASKMAKKND